MTTWRTFGSFTLWCFRVARETPLQEAPRLSLHTGNRILLKREDMQPVFSFKIRGAYNKIAQLSREQLKIGRAHV